MAMPSMTAVAVNPLEGQVKIPLGDTYVVGRLASRAMRWVEESTGKSIDDIYANFVRRAQLAEKGGGVIPGFPVAVAATVLWAAVEHERRHQGLPGPEWTIDDADVVIDTVGLDDAYNLCVLLIQLSAPFKKRSEEIERAAEEAGEESPLAEARRVAAGIGTPTSPAPSGQESATETSGV